MDREACWTAVHGIAKSQTRLSDFTFISKLQLIPLLFAFQVKRHRISIIWAAPQFVNQFSSVVQLCLTLCDPMNCSTPGLPVHYQLLKSTQALVHQVSDAIHLNHTKISGYILPNKTSYFLIRSLIIF